MGCAGNKSVEEKENKKRLKGDNIQKEQQNNLDLEKNVDDQKLKDKEEKKKKEEEEKKKKEEEEKKKKEEEEKKKEEEEKKKKEEEDLNNIKFLTFNSKTIDLKKFRQQELIKHNQLRKLHGTEPLKLNEELNQMAQNYAKVLAKKKL